MQKRPASSPGASHRCNGLTHPGADEVSCRPYSPDPAEREGGLRMRGAISPFRVTASGVHLIGCAILLFGYVAIIVNNPSLT
jgi:hypothetical protein